MNSVKWRDDVLKFCLTFDDDMTWADRADALNDKFGSPDTVYNSNDVRKSLTGACADRLRGMSDVPEDNTGLRYKLSRYLAKARTVADIGRKFELTEHEVGIALDDDYGELEIHLGRNDWNDQTYILLPEWRDEIKVLPREWSCYIQRDELTDTPIYQAVTLKDTTERIKIIPIGDVHLGHRAHLAEKFQATIRYIQEHEGVYWFGGGDFMENALDDGRGMTYDSDVRPRTQLQQITHLIAPIAHKCLFLHAGNHEDRTSKKTDQCPLDIIADKLNIPYYHYPMRMRVQWGDYDWGFNVQHGRSASQTKGGKMNAATKPRNFNDFVEYIVSFHVHDAIENIVTCLCEDKANKRLYMRKQYVLIGQSYLGYFGTYAHKAGWEPPGMGGVGIHIYPNGGYDAKFTGEDDESWETR